MVFCWCCCLESILDRITFMDELKIDDVITAYSPGFHVVVKLEFQTYKTINGECPLELVHYRKIADENGKPFKTKKIKICNRFFCKKITCADIQLLIDKKEEEIKALRKFALENLIR